MFHWAKSNPLGKELDLGASFPGQPAEDSVQAPCPPPLRSGLTEVSRASQPVLSIHGWQSITFSSECVLGSEALSWSLLEIISSSFPDLLNQNLHLTRFPSDFVCVKICHTLVSKTESNVKKRAWEKNISL